MGSSSPYRKELLARLIHDFSCHSPELSESLVQGETAQQAAQRLAIAKADKVASVVATGLVIGSDQTVELNGDILGKPGNFDNALAQLRRMSGQTAIFFTGLCLKNAETGKQQVDVVEYHVTFRELKDEEIQRYLEIEKPFNCAGSFKSEALGISLLESMHGSDPTALVGLPLISLSRMLRQEGIALP